MIYYFKIPICLARFMLLASFYTPWEHHFQGLQKEKTGMKQVYEQNRKEAIIFLRQ